MKIGMEFFTRMHRFRQLRIPEHLGMLPKSEHMLLEILLTQEEKHGVDFVSGTELAKRMSVTTPAVSRTIRHLREDGMIETYPDEKDRRGIQIRLSEKGRNQLLCNRERLEQLMQQAASRLSPGQLEQFFQTFDLFCNSIQTELEQQESSLSERI